MTAITEESTMLISDNIDLQIHQRGAKNRLAGYPGVQAVKDAVTGEEFLDALRNIAREASIQDKFEAEQYVVRVNRILRDTR